MEDRAWNTCSPSRIFCTCRDGEPSYREARSGWLRSNSNRREYTDLRTITDDARRSCPLAYSGYAGSHRPSFVVHYATAEYLETLPGHARG